MDLLKRVWAIAMATLLCIACGASAAKADDDDENRVTLQQQIDALKAQIAAIPTAAAVTVYDSAGKKLGDVIGMEMGIPWVSMTAGGLTFALQVLPSQLFGGLVWFAGANCTGTAYVSDVVLNSDTSSAIALAGVLEPGGVVYVAGPNVPMQTTSVASVFAPQLASCQDFGVSIPADVIPATPVLSLDAVFVKPYTVR